MRIEKYRRGDVTVIALHDGLDRATAAQVRAHLGDLVPDTGRVLLDFGRIASLSGAGLWVLLLIHWHARHKRARVALAGLPAAVRDLFGATARPDAVLVVDSVDDGLRVLAR